ncbi:tyrosine-type recombinase/integrase [Pseudomonas sp. BEA3.1]|uniref:tyrosine-type recombinase/integrase n=1 Tax=Pseudomonas sp. BEA3.1 TaxID=3083251 RepID=UPI002963FF6F|nr:integrase arm-type DNA-binding domain-containing protein [Pseudomonas sp. BEA3.1]MDW2777430.1 tyrosine-type recombinase/integrase [Pseudomonas sp. BEA3.1]
MAINLLSDIQCRNAACEGTAKIKKLHDGDGLYLWAYADGRRYWRLRYWQSGKEKSLSLGTYPKVSLKDARARRDALQKQLAAGLDPSAERKAGKLRKEAAVVNTFEATAREWYGKYERTWAPKYAADVLQRLEVNVFPFIGRRPIGDIEAPELLATVRKVEARGAHDLAHRVLGVCGQVMRYGIATGRCSRDLAADLRGALTPHIKQNQAAIRPEDLPKLLQAIATYDQTGDRQTQLALQLLTYTFVRTGELIGAEWTEFDLDNGLWIVPASRMKMKHEHLVPLAPQVLAILAELKELSRGSRFILPGRNRDRPISNNTMLFALYRLGYKGKMTGHGCRAVASTVLNESGLFSPDVIERALAHCERNAVRGAYNRALYLPQRREMMAWWADHLDEKAKEGIDPTAVAAIVQKRTA